MIAAGRQPLALILALVLCIGAAPASGDELGLYLWRLGEQALADSIRLTEAPVTAELKVDDPAVAAHMLEMHATIDLVQVLDDSLIIRIRGSDTIRRDPASADADASFVIDYDEAAVASIANELAERLGHTPTAEELRQFVYGYITDKTYARSFDIASRVASTRAGDCTEHAFLLTALARAHGYPARVVFGVLMVGSNSQVRSFGHAWSEVHDGSTWRRVDATLPPEPDAETWLRYLPIMPLQNEGPGYMMGLLDLTRVQPTSVRLVDSGEHALQD